MSEDRKAGPGIRTKPHAIRDSAMAIDDAAKRGAEKARFAQRRAKTQPDECKPESDAVGAVEDTEQQLASDVEHAGRPLIHRASAVSREKREAARVSGEDVGSNKESPSQSQSARQDAPVSNAEHPRQSEERAAPVESAPVT